MHVVYLIRYCPANKNKLKVSEKKHCCRVLIAKWDYQVLLEHN